MSIEKLRAATEVGRAAYDAYVAKCIENKPTIDCDTLFSNLWERTVETARQTPEPVVKFVFVRGLDVDIDPLVKFYSELESWKSLSIQEYPLDAECISRFNGLLSNTIEAEMSRVMKEMASRFVKIGTRVKIGVFTRDGFKMFASLDIKWDM